MVLQVARRDLLYGGLCGSAMWAAEGTQLMATANSALASAPVPAGLRAAAAEAPLSPSCKEGIRLVGPMKPCTGENDPLWARALVLSDGTCEAAIITLDYLGFDFAFTELVLEAIAQESGIPAAQIMLNCSHTHSAPLLHLGGRGKNRKIRAFTAS